MNIPKQILEWIKINKISNDQLKDQLVKKIERCMEQNYFRFNKKFYIQMKGLFMASALSSLMVENIYINWEYNLK